METNTLKTVQYALHRSPLLKDKERQYVASVITKETYNIAELVDRMSREGAAVRGSTIRAVLEDFSDLICLLISEGRRVNFNGIFQLYPVIRGTFKNDTDAFTTIHNTLAIGAQGMRSIQAALDLAHTRRVGAGQDPAIFEVRGAVSNEVDTMHVNGIVRIQGRFLKINLSAVDEGIYLLPDGGEEIKVTDVLYNIQNELLFTCPEGLTAGHAKLIIRTRSGGKDDMELIELLQDNITIKTI